METLNKTQARCKLCLIALTMYYLSHHNVAFYEAIQEIKYCFSDGAHVSASHSGDFSLYPVFT